MKRSIVAKVKRKMFTSARGEGVGGRSMNQQVVEIMKCMKSNNNEVVDSGSVIKFRGAVDLRSNQVFFLVFCTGISLVSLVLSFQIQF